MNSLVNQTLHTASYQPNGVEIPLSINEQEKRERYVHEVANDVNALVNTQVFKDQAYERLGITDRSAPVRVQIRVTDHQLYVRKPGQSEWTEVPIDSIARGINQEVLAKGAAIWAETVPESCGMPPPLSTRQTVPIEASQEITRLEEALRSAQAQLEVERRAHEELRHSFGTQGEQLTSRQEELEELRLQNGQLATELEAAHRESDERQVVINRLEQALQGATGRNATLQNQLQEVVATHEEELARLGVDHQEVQERIRNESAAALGALREELTQARTEALDALRLEHADQVRQLNAEHQTELTPLQQRVRELEEQIPRLEDQHRLAIEHLEAAQVVALRDQEQRLNHEHDQAINALQLTHADALRQLEERLTQRQVAALEALQTDHEEALRLRDEAHELAIQGKDHDITELRRAHDEANRELLANHALALRQLTERLIQEKTNALDAVQHNHEEALRDQEQRLGEDKDHALELLQTQQVDALRIQGEGHAIALEELRREYAVAIDAVRNELEETRVQQRAAQEEHEREVSRLTSAFAGERVQYESSNLAIQERLQAAEVRITQHDLLERGQAEELRLTQTALERKVQALEERYKLIVEALLNTDLEPMESIDLDTFDPIERIRGYRAAASQAQANYEHLLAENEDLTRDVRNLQGELAAAHLQHERVHEELSRRLITSTEESDRLQEQEALLLERIQMQSETIGRLTSENLHLKQKLEWAERASSASLEDVREVMAEAEREKQKSDVQLASQKRALEDPTELLADTQNDHRQIEERNGELRGQMKDLERAHKLELEEVDRNILTAVHHAEELLAKNVGLERRLREEQTANVDTHREKDVVMRRQETSLKDLILDLQDHKAINLAALERLQTTARENERLGEETRIITEQLFEAKEQGLLALTHIHDLENRLGIQRTRVKEISAEREAQSTELDELNSQLERLRNPTTAEVGVARDTLE